MTTINSNFSRAITSVGILSKKGLKFQRLTKRKKEKDSTKKWTGFSVFLTRFQSDNISDLKIIGKLVLKLLMSLRVSQKYGVL